MPNRIIREGILSSDRIDQLDAPAEVFYRRLMSKVDDHGLFDARPAMLRASLYPLRVDRVREADIARWIAACEKAGVIALYTHESKPYGQMLDTRWQARSEAKFPLPPWGDKPPSASANSCAQVQAVAPVFGVGVVVGNVDDVPRKRGPRAKPVRTAMPEGFDREPSPRVMAWAQKEGFDRLGEHLQAFARKCAANSYVYADWDAAFMEAVREDWAKLRGRTPTGAAPPAESAADDISADRERAQQELARQAEHAAAIAAQSPAERAAVSERLAKARQVATEAASRHAVKAAA